MLVLICAIFGLFSTVLYSWKLSTAIQQASRYRLGLQENAPSLSLHYGSTGSESNSTGQGRTVAVVVPAYNEADNVEACLLSILKSASNDPETVNVYLVDDQSTDDTWAIAHSLHQHCNDPRLHLLTGQPRPKDKKWVGKNWACAQGAAQATGDYLLFLDADVRLKLGAIATALQFVEQEKIDLLTCIPSIVCGCFAEWLVQPLMAIVLFVGFNIAEVNDAQSKTAFGSGPFMLFRRTAYDAIGGHGAVAEQVVEDVELARLVKAKGLKLHYMPGLELSTVRMYHSWGSLWEGWTKNLYPGSQRNLGQILFLSAIMLVVYTLPWMIVLLVPMSWIWFPWSAWSGAAIALSVLTICLQYRLRQQIEGVSGIPPRYWWLMGLGGAAVAAIAIVSIIKTETGWGWTWRGRPLKTGN